MTLSRRSAMVAGLSAIAAVLLLQAFNSFACYHQDFAAFVTSTAIFVAAPLVPAVVSLTLPNPLRAVGACALLIPWLLLAYYTDCVRPYSGGGASMIYVAVLLWGTPSAIIGALAAGPVTRWVGIQVLGRPN